MKQTRWISLFLALAMLASLLALPVSADEIWVENPTGYTKASDVKYVKSGNYIVNWGVRGETATFLTSYAQSYYTGDYAYETLSKKQGSTNPSSVPSSQLYKSLSAMMNKKSTSTTSYNGTRDLYKYTDCMVSNYSYISSFYSGTRLNGAWDSGKTWNREHTWPNSKISGSGENDIMMLRPTSVKENSDRGNKAYGESNGYYDPNSEANGKFNLHGDCARIVLYVYVRWGVTDTMWGAGGVMENLDVLLKWMQEDPVDTWEMGRNDAVQSITGVRNAFVDYPEYAWLLFGQTVPAGYQTPSSGKTEPPHTHSYVEIARKEATCADAGSVTYRCDCGDTYTETIPALGHDWDAGFVTREPTEDTVGIKTFTCQRCKQTRTEEIPKLTHTHSYTDTVTPPTCTEQGYTTHTCQTCGESYVDTYVAALGHAFGEWTVSKAASCTQAGEEARRCSRCQEVETRVLAQLSHQYVDGVCTLCGAKDPTAQPTPNPFTDVTSGSYYNDSVQWAVAKGVTNGTSETTFSPDAPCTRAQVVTFLWRANGKPGQTSDVPDGDPDELPVIPVTTVVFTDVRRSDYFYPAVQWAVAKGITNGTSETTFSPGAPCTRAQVVTFLWRSVGSPAPKSGGDELPIIPIRYVGAFTDVPSEAYYANAVLWALQQNVTQGTGKTTFSPNATCTRAQVVTFLYRAVK